METTGEMNWQLLIKMVSSSLARPPCPLLSLPATRLSILSLVSGKSTGSRKNWLRSAASRGQERASSYERGRGCDDGNGGGGGCGGGEGLRSSSSGGDAVSILFVHANYSSSVTLLEIEGTAALSSPLSPLSSPLSPPSPRHRPFSLFSVPLCSPLRPFLFPSSSIFFSLALGVS